jgi:secondary thiamine-phosphate synthase enzyme
MPKFSVKTTRKNELVDITAKVTHLVNTADVEDGIALVYTLHTSAAIVVLENWDPSIVEDFFACMNKLVPEGNWKHDAVDGNGAAHLKSALIGPSQSFPVVEGKLVLGKWQGIGLAEFDGPREREVLVIVT